MEADMTPPSGPESGREGVPDVTDALEEMRKKVRSRFSVRSLSDAEIARLEDITWAQQDPDVQSRFRGEFVVPVGKQVVAHGYEAEQVLQEASQVTNRAIRDLPLVSVVDFAQEALH